MNINIYIDINLLFSKNTLEKINNLNLNKLKNIRFFDCMLKYFNNNFNLFHLINKYFKKLKNFDEAKIFLVGDCKTENVKYILGKLELIIYFNNILFVKNNIINYIIKHSEKNNKIYITKNLLSIFYDVNPVIQFNEIINENTLIELIKKYFTIYSNYF